MKLNLLNDQKFPKYYESDCSLDLFTDGDELLHICEKIKWSNLKSEYTHPILYFINLMFPWPAIKFLNARMKLVSFHILSGFSFTDTGDSRDRMGSKGTLFVPLYHFHPLTDIQTFICKFAYEMTITYF